MTTCRAKLLYSKAAHKESRRPKYGGSPFRRGLPETETNYGADVGRLLELLEVENRRRE